MTRKERTPSAVHADEIVALLREERGGPKGSAYTTAAHQPVAVVQASAVHPYLTWAGAERSWRCSGPP